VLDTCRGKHSTRGSHGLAGKGHIRAAVPALAAIAIIGLYLAPPSAASAAQPPAAVPAATPTAGTALAWGDNTFGELGNGTTGGISSTPVPVDLPAGTAVTAIAAGEGHALALTSVGRVLTWGDNEFGQLGIGTITGGSPVPVPVDLPAGIRVTAVAGSQSSLALTSTGTVLAWGDNDYGELGDRGTANSPVPVSVDLPAGTSVTAISAGLKNSLAVTVHTSC
jgi:alpha-tubulin suppressor-like RCC1 family protein